MREKDLTPAEVLRAAGTDDPMGLVHRGIAAAKKEQFERGLILLTEAYNRFGAGAEGTSSSKLLADSASVAGRRTPTLLLSYLGLCLSMTKGRYREAARLCEMAIRHEPFHVDHYLNLARVWEAGRSPKNVVGAIERGLAVTHAPALLALQKEFGARKTPVVPFLQRDNPVNRALGKLRHKIDSGRPAKAAAPPRRRPQPPARSAPSDIIDLDAQGEVPPVLRTRPPKGR
jgi:hypothetical protein